MTLQSTRRAGKRPDNSRPMWFVMLCKYGVFGSFRLLRKDILPDLLQGTDTARPVAPQRDENGQPIPGRNRYVPSTFDAVASCLAYLSDQVNFSQSNFVDFGSGKGKALIAASRQPFIRVLGIEVDPKLHAIACRNLDRLKFGPTVRSMLSDASTYLPNERDRVLYFFNPFTGAALHRCLQNIANNSSGITRYIVYVNPTEDAVFKQYFDKLDEMDFQPGGVEVNFYRTRN